MNPNESNHGNDSKRTDSASVSSIRSDKSSKDASGVSASGREPQQGGAIDNSSSRRDGSHTGGGSKR